jgi:hypothetical protein
MKIFEIEQAPVTAPAAPDTNAALNRALATPQDQAPAQPAPDVAPTMPAGQAPTDPAKAEAERKKTIAQQRTAIQGQIKSLDDQKKALQQQLATLK